MLNERKLATIMFMDIADYTALSAKWVSQILEDWGQINN